MKRTTDPLLDDLLADSVPPEFRAALLDKTLQSARQRRRRRRFNQALGAAALVGILAIACLEMRAPTAGPDQVRRSDSSVANSPPSSPAPMIGTKSDPAPALTVVQTTESARPREISNQQFLALLSDQQVALVCQDTRHAELIFLNSKDEQGFPVR